MNMNNENFFPGMDSYVERILDENRPKSRQFTEIFNSTINLFEFGLQVFSIITIRVYEDKLTKETEDSKKKTKPINEALKNKFVSPSLGTHNSLARTCVHLIDDTAPVELIEAKEKLNESILMGSIGTFLNDLTQIFDTLEEAKEGKAKVINRETSKRTFLLIISDFVAFRNTSSHLVNIASLIEDNSSSLKLNIQIWREAYNEILFHLKPLLNFQYTFKSIEKFFLIGETRMISIRSTTFFSGVVTNHNENIKLEDWNEDQWNERSEIFLTDKKNKKKPIDIFPFLVLKEANI
jgi:hypothetical protein